MDYIVEYIRVYEWLRVLWVTTMNFISRYQQFRILFSNVIVVYVYMHYNENK